MGTMVCVGGGGIGSRAVAEARRKGDRAVVVDIDPGCPAAALCDRRTADADAVLDAPEGEALFLQGDGVAVLLDLLRRWVPDRVVPAARGHLAALLATEHARAEGRGLAPSPDTLDAVMMELPSDTVLLVDRPRGAAVTSHMPPGGRCPEDCERPPLCPVTGRRIDRPLHQLIEGALARSVDRAAVLVTQGSGVGSVAGGELRELLGAVEGTESGASWGIATSCACHGIINALRVL